MERSETSLKILLIDDNADTARMVIRLLTKRGFDVHHAATGLAGLQMARHIHPNLILVDLVLPDLPGNIVALQLRHLFEKCTTKIAAFTAEVGNRAERIAKKFGCDYFISKPINTQTFAEEVYQIYLEKE